jgi:NADH dehydrogenase
MKTKARLIFEDLPYPNVVIVGGGFAGLTLVKNLANRPVKVTLIDKNNYHTFQPLLYQVATASLTPDSIGYPFRRMVGPMNNIVFRMAEVQEIDFKGKEVTTTSGTIPYDILVLATGSTTNFFGNEQIARHAMQLKSIPQALDIRSVFLQEFEKAARLVDSNDTEGLRTALNFVIVGGGPTGVEVAGALAEIKRDILRKEYREIDPDLMEITLVEAADSILLSMTKKSSERAKAYLEKMGVQVLTNALVTSYDGHKMCLHNGITIHTETVIWAAGVKGNALKGLSPTAYLPNGRLLVDEYNIVNGHEFVFALGDIAQMNTTDYPRGHPMVAQVALQQAENFAKNIFRVSHKKSAKPFVYVDKGSMATVGRNKAVAEIGNIKMGGALAWYVWMAVHILFLIGFRNRLAVFFNWAIKYFSHKNTIRLIVRPYLANTKMGDR